MPRTAGVHRGQQWVRLAIYQLVFSPLHGWKSVRVQFDEPGLAVQRDAARHIRQLQALTADEAYAPPGRRCARQRRGAPENERDGAEDQLGLTGEARRPIANSRHFGQSAWGSKLTIGVSGVAGTCGRMNGLSV